MITDTMLTTAIETLQNTQLKVNTNSKHRLYVFIETLKKCLTQNETERLTSYETLKMFKTHFGIAQGYEEDLETQIEAYEYVIEIEHNKEDDMLNIEEFKRFDDILHAIVQQSNGTLIIDEQAYNSFKDQVLNSGKYETSLTAYGQEKLNEVIEPMLSENSCEDDSIDLFDMPVYEKEEKQCTMYDETCEPEPCDIPEEVECTPLNEEDYENCVPNEEDCVPCEPEEMPWPEEDDNPLGLARCTNCGTLFDCTPKDLVNRKMGNERRCYKCKRIMSIVQIKAQIKD